MDYMEIKASGSKRDIILTAENEDIDLHRPNGMLLSNAQQQQEFPGDTGLQFLERLTDLEVRWPGSERVTIGRPSHVSSRSSVGYYR